MIFINKIRRSLIIEVIVLIIILVISILKSNITPLFTGTTRSFIPIQYNTFKLFYFLLMILSFIRITLIYNKTRQIEKDNTIDENEVKRLADISEIFSFIFNTIITTCFLLAFIFTITTVRGDSMKESFFDGDRVIVWHFNQSFNQGDPVIVYFEQNSVPFLLKRIKGVSGDNISVGEPNETNYKKLLINGEYIATISVANWFKISAPYIKGDENSFVIPNGKYFVLGDNVNNSVDSRTLGLVERKNIVGTVIFRMSPIRSFGRL